MLDGLADLLCFEYASQGGDLCPDTPLQSPQLTEVPTSDLSARGSHLCVSLRYFNAKTVLGYYVYTPCRTSHFERESFSQDTIELSSLRAAQNCSRNGQPTSTWCWDTFGSLDTFSTTDLVVEGSLSDRIDFKPKNQLLY